MDQISFYTGWISEITDSFKLVDVIEAAMLV